MHVCGSKLVKNYSHLGNFVVPVIHFSVDTLKNILVVKEDGFVSKNRFRMQVYEKRNQITLYLQSRGCKHYNLHAK